MPPPVHDAMPVTPKLPLPVIAPLLKFSALVLAELPKLATPPSITVDPATE
ncbi:MAG TPA: hypothetical protein VH518_18440 [Tepidisphaeraceae bacterium]